MGFILGVLLLFALFNLKGWAFFGFLALLVILYFFGSIYLK